MLTLHCTELNKDVDVPLWTIGYSISDYLRRAEKLSDAFLDNHSEEARALPVLFYTFESVESPVPLHLSLPYHVKTHLTVDLSKNLVAFLYENEGRFETRGIDSSARVMLLNMLWTSHPEFVKYVHALSPRIHQDVRNTMIFGFYECVSISMAHMTLAFSVMDMQMVVFMWRHWVRSEFEFRENCMIYMQWIYVHEDIYLAILLAVILEDDHETLALIFKHAPMFVSRHLETIMCRIRLREKRNDNVLIKSSKDPAEEGIELCYFIDRHLAKPKDEITGLTPRLDSVDEEDSSDSDDDDSHTIRNKVPQIKLSPKSSQRVFNQTQNIPWSNSCMYIKLIVASHITSSIECYQYLTTTYDIYFDALMLEARLLSELDESLPPKKFSDFLDSWSLF